MKRIVNFHKQKSKYLYYLLSFKLQEIKTFLDSHLNNKDGVASSFDSLVVVFFSGGYEYEPGNIYDKKGNKIDKDEIFTMMKESKAFKGKPKIVIIRTYSFEGAYI